MKRTAAISLSKEAKMAVTVGSKSIVRMESPSALWISDCRIPTSSTPKLKSFMKSLLKVMTFIAVTIRMAPSLGDRRVLFVWY